MRRKLFRAMHARTGLESESFDLDFGKPVLIGAAMTWERAADPAAKAWPESADRFTVTMYCGDDPLEPFAYHMGTGNRVTYLYQPPREISEASLQEKRLPARHTKRQWDHSAPVVPLICDLLECITLDAGIYEEARDDANPVDGLISLGFVDPSAPGFTVASAMEMFQEYRGMWHRLQVFHRAGVSRQMIEARLEDRGYR